jgi:hypothetical protein
VNTSAAVTRLTEIENMQTSKKNHAHVLTYEISQNQPIGLSTGSYKLKRVGGYFTFRLNTEVFDAARNNPKFYIPANIASLKANSSEDDIDDDANFSPEVNISFGWTVPLFHTIMGGQTFALHTFFGPGFTAMVQYKWKSETLMEYKKEPSYEAMSEKELTAKNDVFETDNYSRSMKMSVSPEIGICVRWSFVALRYTFQYRFAVKKEYEDFLGKTRSVFGVGVAF